MCAIFGSRDKKEFFELAKLNGYRGVHSHSLAYLKDGFLQIVEKDFGPLEEQDLPENALYIGHQQAPTTDAKDKDSIHPATYYSAHLWHNGIIKDHQVKQWQEEDKHNWPWDTMHLAYRLSSKGYDVLSEADGSFACLYWTGHELNLFRNSNCPMFISNSSFSSTKFAGAVPILPERVYKYDENQYAWFSTKQSFKTKETFFWSPE